MVETGGAVIACSMTTLSGYLALLMSVNGAVRSFGLTAVSLAAAAARGARMPMSPSLRIVTAVAIGAGLAAAAGGALRSAGRGARMRWLAAGAGLGLLITLVR